MGHSTADAVSVGSGPRPELQAAAPGRRPPGEILRRGVTRPRPPRVGASAWEHLELGIGTGADVASVLLLFPGGNFHAAVYTQHADGGGEELTAATHGSWCTNRGGVLLEFPEDSDEGLEYELVRGHLVASAGALPEGLAQEYATGQPDSTLVRTVAQLLLMDLEPIFQASAAAGVPPAPAILDRVGRVEAQVEEPVRVPVVIEDGDDGLSDGSCSTGLTSSIRPAATASGAADEGIGAGDEEDYADDFEPPSDDDGG